MKESILWQSRSVDTFSDSSWVVPYLGSAVPIKVESYAYPSGFKITHSQGAGLIETEITEPSLEVSFGMVSDTDRLTFTGRVRLLFSTKMFVRNVDGYNEDRLSLPDIELTLPLDLRDERVYKIIVNATKGINAYVSIAYEESSGKWCFSAEHLMAHDVVRPLSGEWGARLFNLMPSYQRKVDVDYGDPLNRLLTLFGGSLDDLEPIIDQLKGSYAPSTVALEYLPYIDRLLGWATNFELPEDIRRYETEQAVELWKSKGSPRGLELLMQNTIGWDVEIFEGDDWVVTTNVAPLEQPIDWVEGESDANTTESADTQPTGVWSDVQTPYMATWSPELGTNVFSPRSNIMTLPSTTGWKRPNGVLIRLSPTPGSRTFITELALKKAKNLLTLFVPHYAEVFFTALIYHRESLNIGFTGAYEEDLFETQSAGTEFPLDMGDTVTDTVAVGVLPFSTHPEPTEMNNKAYRLFHVGVSYRG